MANRVQNLTIETTRLVSTSFLSKSQGACRKRPLSSGVPGGDLMLFWLLSAVPAGGRQNGSKQYEWPHIARRCGRESDEGVRNRAALRIIIPFTVSVNRGRLAIRLF